MSDTDCTKCHQPLQLGDGYEWGVEEEEILCWSCQQDEIRRLRSLLSSGEKSFGEWWRKTYGEQSGYVKVRVLPSTTALHLARPAFLAGFWAGGGSPEVAGE